MRDGTGLAEAMLGLDGFRILEVVEDADELVIMVETTTVVAACMRCGTRAEAHDRRAVDVRDLPMAGRPVRLRVLKRRWRCVEPSCEAKTWTEQHPALPPRAVMTHRAGFEAARQVGELARPVSQVADEFGVCWDTIMAAVERHGTPLVDDPDRVGQVEHLGVDETSFLRATRTRPTRYATGLVDTSRESSSTWWKATLPTICVDGVNANPMGGWRESSRCRSTSPIRTAPGSARISTTPCGWRTRFMWCGSPAVWTRSAAACRTKRSAIAVGRPIRCIGSASSSSKAPNASTTPAGTGCCWDCGSVTPTTRWPAPGWRKNPSETSTWSTTPPTRPSWSTRRSSAAVATTSLRSRALGRTLSRWRTEILNHHRTGASNGPTEGLNLVIKKVKRAGHGFRRFDHYRLRCLLHAGGITWPNRPTPPRIRTRRSPLR
ncbi:MAG: hypothetical protein KatS3mg011_1769 [Acidimicrobiia bacterium]|nr:MAG: hypothetical protein KatS3mg011_1769 [Acidimicrobiia bacterium]